MYIIHKLDVLDTGGLFLWAQSMFVLAQLLTGGLLHVNELDPIRRYLPSYNRPRRAGRYSAFQVYTHVIRKFQICPSQLAYNAPTSGK